jgi:catechol-2,3-dioxygenase
MNYARREPVGYLLPGGNGIGLYYERPREQWTEELDLA